MDTSYLDTINKTFSQVITIEEGTVVGGFGDCVAGWLLENGFTGRFKKIGLPDLFVEHGKRDEILSMLNLDADGLTKQIKNFCLQKENKIS